MSWVKAVIKAIKRAWYRRVLRQLRTQQQFANRDQLTSEGMHEYIANRISQTEIKCKQAGMTEEQISRVEDYETMSYAIYAWMLMGMSCAMGAAVWWVQPG